MASGHELVDQSPTLGGAEQPVCLYIDPVLLVVVMTLEKGSQPMHEAAGGPVIGGGDRRFQASNRIPKALMIDLERLDAPALLGVGDALDGGEKSLVLPGHVVGESPGKNVQILWGGRGPR